MTLSTKARLRSLLLTGVSRDQQFTNIFCVVGNGGYVWYLGMDSEFNYSRSSEILRMWKKHGKHEKTEVSKETRKKKREESNFLHVWITRIRRKWSLLIIMQQPSRWCGRWGWWRRRRRWWSSSSSSSASWSLSCDFRVCNDCMLQGGARKPTLVRVHPLLLWSNVYPVYPVYIIIHSQITIMVPSSGARWTNSL